MEDNCVEVGVSFGRRQRWLLHRVVNVLCH